MEEKYNGLQRPTKYNNHWYDSQLEAQWGVFFDVAGIANIPHPGTFRTGRFWQGEEIVYSPDFYLPETGDFCEVKPSDKFIQNCNIQRKISAAMENGITPVARGLLILGPMSGFHHNETKQFCLSGEYYRWCGAIAKSRWLIGEAQDGEMQTVITYTQPDYDIEENFSHYPYLGLSPSACVTHWSEDPRASEMVYKAIFDAIYAKGNGLFTFEETDEQNTLEIPKGGMLI